MNTKSWKNGELDIYQQNLWKKNHNEEIFLEHRNDNSAPPSIFTDKNDFVYQDLSLLSFKSQNELSIATKQVSNSLDHKSETNTSTKLVNLDDFSETVGNNSSSFDLSFFDPLPILSNHSTENYHEKTLKDESEVFDCPFKDFSKDKLSINNNNLYVQKDLLDFYETNEHHTLKDKMVMQLIDMGFNRDQVLREVEMAVNMNMKSCKYSSQRDTIHVSPESELSEKLRIINTLDFENEEKLLLHDKVEQRINKWINGKEYNLRALISTLDQVLWDSMGWENINMTNLLSTSQVKKAYIKAISKIHPDKVVSLFFTLSIILIFLKLPKDALVEQKMIASSVFNYLNRAWNNFKTENTM
ncbi:hypothetical protein PCK2_000052 [Pneumocystis canis]|nr:hypothetical protein PCK2_000052 [Pneumocystis canis]